MPRAKKPAPVKPAADAPKKASVKDSLSWKLARVDLVCGHSVTRIPEHARESEVWCLACEQMQRKIA